jgi:hypoxanthine phosphoribosyltransferase|tara:strand:+ start:8343 stop:8771 length:429 start_codon:yes stop_codon:yes gene_type:complete
MIVYSNEDTNEMILSIGRYLDISPPDMVVGLKRGGLVPAVSLSHMFGVPMESLSWSTRDFSQRELNLEVKDAVLEGLNVVFIDDINDSGATLTEVQEAYGTADNIRYVSLVSRKGSVFNTDFTAATIEDGTWVEFPWENIKL